MKIANMRLGTAFQLTIMGAVYVRCYGGYRSGCGGILRKCGDLKGAVYNP